MKIICKFALIALAMLAATSPAISANSITGDDWLGKSPLMVISYQTDPRYGITYHRMLFEFMQFNVDNTLLADERDSNAWTPVESFSMPNRDFDGAFNSTFYLTSFCSQQPCTPNRSRYFLVRDREFYFMSQFDANTIQACIMKDPVANYSGAATWYCRRVNYKISDSMTRAQLAEATYQAFVWGEPEISQVTPGERGHIECQSIKERDGPGVGDYHEVQKCRTVGSKSAHDNEQYYYRRAVP